MCTVLPDEHNGIVIDSPAAEVQVEPRRRRGVGPAVGAVARQVRWAAANSFGLLALLVTLAALATIPILQLASLGYLLEVCGRVAKSGRLRDGFVGVRKAARFGRFVLGTALMLIPLAAAKYYGYLAFLVDETSPATRNWNLAAQIILGLTAVHVLAAWYCGARWRDFFWPLWGPMMLPVVLWRRQGLSRAFPPLAFIRAVLNGRWWSESRDAFWEFLVSLRLPYYWWLGFRGLFSAIAWLLLPVALLVHAIENPQGPGPLLGLLGGVLFVFVILWLPYLQVNFAVQGQMKAMFQPRNVREMFRHAPIAYAAGLATTLVLAFPLYLLKIEATPQEAAALPALFFVAFNFPARLATGWAVGRARRRTQRRHFMIRLISGSLAIPLAATYVLLVFFTQYSSWYGTWSLLEQHAFLVPVPFLGHPGP